MQVAYDKSHTISVVLITLNEGHNLRTVLDNLKGWADDIWIVDSYSKDDTIDIALSYGVNVVQRAFRGFGEQWNFALSLPFTTGWVMKLDPDERVSDELKLRITETIYMNQSVGITVDRHLYFLGGKLPVKQRILRVWPTGACRFSDVLVNEHPIVNLPYKHVEGVLEHWDSPNLHHWFNKQNRYTTSEALSQANKSKLSAKPVFFGNSLERRMWIKKNFWKIPGRFLILFLYHYLYLGAWRAGSRGYYWSQLRTFVYWQWQLKFFEISKNGNDYCVAPEGAGSPDHRIKQIS